MNHLSRNDYASALRVLTRIEARAGDLEDFARALVLALNDYVAAELTALWVCDLRTGHRHVVGLPEGRPGDYCRRMGPVYAMAVPLFGDYRTLVNMVLSRRGLDFSERDRQRLDLLRPHLAFLYRHACKAAAKPAGETQEQYLPVPPDIGPPGLTARETAVMQWLACGKTDAEIAALLSISPRTVQKHLEHVYVKLGVETRTAAVMRMLAISDGTVLGEPPSPRQTA
ncbi:MAG: helix-turn-helix transcriptional regulator [Polaromonas sp.]